MTYTNNLFPVAYMEERPATQSDAVKVVFSADTGKTYDDLFLKMSSFLKEEIDLISSHREEMRNKYPELLLE